MKPIRISQLNAAQVAAVFKSERFCQLTDSQLAALHHRVDEMCGADHHGIDGAFAVRVGAQPRERVEDAGCDIFGGRCLDGASHRAAIDQDGVRVGSADIDSDPSHDANTDLKSRS